MILIACTKLFNVPNYCHYEMFTVEDKIFSNSSFYDFNIVTLLLLFVKYLFHLIIPKLFPLSFNCF